MSDNAHTAVTWHSIIVTEFDERYKTNRNFKERYKIWTSLIDKYTKPEGQALDLGCGSGVFSSYLSGNHKQVTAIDASDKMIECCKEKNKKHKVQNLEYLTGDITKLPDAVTDKKYDIITCSSVLEYIEDIDSVLKQVENVLKDDGTFLVSIPNKRSLFRKIEPYLHKYIGRPRYYKFVKTVLNVKDMREHLSRYNMEDVSCDYYAMTPFLSVLFRKIGLRQFSDNQYVLACKKKKPKA